MVTINPADCQADEVYEATVDGDLCFLVRNDPVDDRPWSGLHRNGCPEFYLSDDDVPDLVRLVPAREVTRDDLPSVGDMVNVFLGGDGVIFGVSDALDSVVAHLNANGGLPASSGVLSSAADCVLESAERVKAAEYERDCWRRAHSIVKQERNQARAERDEAKRNRDEAASRLAGVRDAHQRSADAHMKWKARAEAAERERDEADDRLTAKLVAARRERDEAVARAEAAEARTAPAVTRDEVLDAVTAVFEHERNRGDDGRFAWPGTRPITDAVCALFGVEAEPADPVEQKAVELYEILNPLGVWDDEPDEARKRHRRLAAHVLDGQNAR